MHITKEAGFYRISRITGPTHNCLRLAVTLDERVLEPAIESLPPVGLCRHRPLDATQIREAVLRGVMEANTAFGTAYQVQHIQYVENDTPPEQSYSVLAYSLIRYLATANEL